MKFQTGAGDRTLGSATRALRTWDGCQRSETYEATGHSESSGGWVAGSRSPGAWSGFRRNPVRNSPRGGDSDTPVPERERPYRPYPAPTGQPGFRKYYQKRCYPGCHYGSPLPSPATLADTHNVPAAETGDGQPARPRYYKSYPAPTGRRRFSQVLPEAVLPGLPLWRCGGHAGPQRLPSLAAAGPRRAL